MLWPASEVDGLYGRGLVQYGGTVGRIGTELCADVRWRVDQICS